MSQGVLERTSKCLRTSRAASHPSRILVVIGWLIALCAVAPIAFLLSQAIAVGWAALSAILFRQLTLTLLINTVEMTVLTTSAAAVLGVGAAWLLERTDVPARRLLFVVLLVPAAIPDFIETFGWVNAAPWLRGLWGSVFVLSLATYPFVMLPVIAGLRRVDHRREEVARSLGASTVRVFWRVTLPEIRVAIAGGCLLVALQLMAEYGSFEMLGFRTFTTEIFTAFKVGFDSALACALSLVLVVLSALVVRTEASVSERQPFGVGSEVVVPHRLALGWRRWLCLLGLVGLALLALGVPVGSIVSLLADPGGSTLPAASLWGAVGHTLAYATSAAVLATAGATALGLSSYRARSWLARVPSTMALVPLAVPGVVIAFAFTYASEHYLASHWYQSTPLLIVAYTVMFLPLALIGVRTSLAQVPASLTEAAASLGAGRARQFVRVTLPLITPGLGVAFALVFLAVLTELTATLILIPTGATTLATQFWAYQSSIAYGQAAPYAAAMIVLAGIPLALLTGLGERARRRAP